MDLRNLPEQLSSLQRVNQRRTLLEQELKIDLRNLEPVDRVIGDAEKKNCENMFGVVPMPVGAAGPLTIVSEGGQKSSLYLPLATTEGALVASVNRGCKAITACGGAIIRDLKEHGITRSIALRATSSSGVQDAMDLLRQKETLWKKRAEETSKHLKVLGYDLDIQKQYIFLTLRADTDEAMGMNMITIAAESVAEWVTEELSNVRCITVAGNVDSDKKPSRRTHERGRGIEVTTSILLSANVITDVLKTTAPDMVAVAKAKLDAGSTVAGSIGSNLHAANIVAALYAATGQDIAHTVEGSLSDTRVEEAPDDGLSISVRMPAILAGVRGGGTTLPAQTQCLRMILGQHREGKKAKLYLAEVIAGAVLAGEVSLLAAQASRSLGTAHKTLGR